MNIENAVGKIYLTKGGDWVEFVLKYEYTINKVRKCPLCRNIRSAGKETTANAKKKSEASGWTV